MERMTKTCSRCKKTKRIIDFPRVEKSGLHMTVCRECVADMKARTIEILTRKREAGVCA